MPCTRQEPAPAKVQAAKSHVIHVYKGAVLAICLPLAARSIPQVINGEQGPDTIRIGALHRAMELKLSGRNGI